MEFSTIVENRHSIKEYDSTVTISDAQLKSLFDTVVLSPSAFNLQHWTFVVARDPTLKQELQAAALGQPQVGSCSAVVMVCGRLDAHTGVREVFQGAPEEVVAKIDGIAQHIYANSEQMQRDEAIRGATLAAMSLMYAATDQGLESGGMIGYDPAAVSSLLEIPDNYIPVMMVVLGTSNGEAPPRSSRRPLDEVVKLEKFSGTGLA
ncbi:MAG: nitroreductase family protein [Gammaproteobacteria bacterium]|nr:MAG: nitroreductase family protein [Gammaproteobacteria bacterium]